MFERNIIRKKEKVLDQENSQLIQQIIEGIVSDAAYGPGWDGVTTIAPSKNAVYDELEAIVAGAAADAFKTITGITNDVVADNVADTLTLAAAGGLTIVGTAATDTITFTNTITQYTDALVRDVITAELADGESIDQAIDDLIATVNEISEMFDVDLTGVADENILVYESDDGKFYDKTPAEYADMIEDHIVHNNLAEIDAGDINHLTDAQVAALHAIYTLEVHNNDHHDPDHLIDPILLAEIAEQDTPAANKLVMWTEDFAGHTVLRFRTADGHIHTIGECMHKVGRNTSGTGIARGKIVYYNGTTTGRHPNFSLAKADALATMPVIGITLEAVNDDAYAELMIMGRITGLDTSAWAPGTVLYASATVAGGLTDSFPPHPYLDQQIGIVEVQNAGAGVILIDIRVLQGRNDGTIRQSFSIGDGASGDVTLKFDGDAGNDGSIVYDVSDDEFDFDRQINMNTKKIIGVVDPTADQDVATKKFTDDHNWAEADIIDLDKYNQATVDSKDVAVGDRFDEQSAAFPGAPSEGDLHYDEDLDSLYRYNAEAEAWIEIGVGGGTSGDNLGSHIATQDLDMANFKIVNLDIKTLNAAERTTTSDTYAKLKETMVQVSGTITFYWQMKKVVGGVLVFSKLYVNGAAVGVEKSSLSTDYVNYSDSIAVTKGDLVQLYGKKQDDTTCYVRNFYLENFGNINWSY